MKNEAIIKFVTTQTTDDNEQDTLEINAQGTYEKTETGFVIEYDEIDEEMQGTKTTVTVESPSRIIINRAGTYNSRLTIEENKRHSCHYDTPAGSLIMGVFASLVSVNLREKGGTVRLRYTIDFNSSMVAKNFVHLTGRTKPNSKV
jgi:uncharacterized beta-barrel protein YwiB (DUF1934 family)